jgi:DNA-binding transcriptional regulator GbsR (MarR family)
MKKFILHWGEMGTRWGVNRTVAQIHALLYLSPNPLCAEEIAETLSVARSNVSNSVRELQSWNLVRVVHHFGDRRDHFESEKDIWRMFMTVLDERKKREIDPTVAVVEECIAAQSEDNDADAYARERLENMRRFLETTTTWYREVRRLPPTVLIKMVELGGKIDRLVSAIR